jgi:hypothetical protein
MAITGAGRFISLAETANKSWPELMVRNISVGVGPSVANPFPSDRP